MEDQFPKLKALMDQKRANKELKERKEQQAKAAAAVQQHKQTVQAVEHDTLRDWVATQNARMKQAPPKAETKDSLADWTFEKQKF
jgi:hypothetical protein